MKRLGSVIFLAALVTQCAALGPVPTPSPSLISKLQDASEALAGRASMAASSPLDQPFLVAHQLLGCGVDCLTPNGEPLYLVWLDGQIPDESLGYFHPGQLVSLGLELGLSFDEPIQLTSGSVVTLRMLLSEEQVRFDMPPNNPTPSERQRGAEYGWLLRVFCSDLTPMGRINPAWSVEDVLENLMAQGIPNGGEGQTHELEGLGHCLRDFGVAEHPVKANLQKFLIERMRDDLNHATADGQLYADRTDFDQCDDEEGICALVGALNRQAHFFEWASLVSSSSEELRLALERFLYLIQALTLAIDDLWTGTSFRRHAMVIAATAHTRHAIASLRLGTLSEP